MPGKSFPIVLVAPSGTGKTTICKQVLKILPRLKYSISVTTRPPREGETDGKDYYFIPETTFKDWVKANKFYEWAEVYGNLYGTLKEPVLQHLREGYHVLLDLDIQGARSIKAAHPEGIGIFISPPSISELNKRLLKRGKDSPEVIEKRLQAAARELEYFKDFNYVVVNDSLEVTIKKIKSIVIAEECKTKGVL